MYKFKTFNNISEQALSLLTKAKFEYDDVEPDAILIRSHTLINNDFNQNLKSIARAGAGFNNIPVELATKNGIVVFNTPGANSNAVKELVICGMLLSSRGIIQGSAFAKSLIGKDETEINNLMEKEKKIFKGNELKGKILGIVGLGSVGSLLAQAASILDMKIIGYDPYISVDAAWMLPKEVEKAENLEFLLSNSDYISLHVPLSNLTKNLVSKKLLDNVKDRTVLVFHKRRRKHSRKKNGHRQRHSKIQITKILSKDGKVIDEAKAVVAKKASKEVASKKTAAKETVSKKKVVKK